ncbi:MAG: FtsH protease activity modulator HflK [Legionellales bacterium]|nr:FtsH protease activity modulator HflK [Legionellales bacterium]
MEDNKSITIQRSDPWNKKKDTPPDLDELLVKWRRSILGKSPKKNNNKEALGFGVSLMMLLLVSLWLISGFFIVSPSEKAVVLRFGEYYKTLDAGPHWIPQFIDHKQIVNVNNVSQFGYGAQMLTKDENIVDVELSVQYQVSNPQEFLFNVAVPTQSIKEATASALRQVVGHTSLDEILTTGREKAREEVERQLVEILDIYKTGLHVVDVNLQPAKPPEQVTEAFDDAIKAREDQQRFINQAQAYKEKVIPISQGQSSRIIQEASAYKAKVTLDAKGDVAKFLALLEEHSRAPNLTNQRLYYASLEKVFANTSKILIDNSGSNNILYLPLDKLSSSNSNEKDVVSDQVTLKQSEIEEIVKRDDEYKSHMNANRPSYFNQNINRTR